jgi:hypothetical protein
MSITKRKGIKELAVGYLVSTLLSIDTPFTCVCADVGYEVHSVLPPVKSSQVFSHSIKPVFRV